MDPPRQRRGMGINLSISAASHMIPPLSALRRSLLCSVERAPLTPLKPAFALPPLLFPIDLMCRAAETKRFQQSADKMDFLVLMLTLTMEISMQ